MHVTATYRFQIAGVESKILPWKRAPGFSRSQDPSLTLCPAGWYGATDVNRRPDWKSLHRRCQEARQGLRRGSAWVERRARTGIRQPSGRWRQAAIAAKGNGAERLARVANAR